MTEASEFDLAAGSPHGQAADWQKSIETLLAGKDPSSLRGQTYGGLPIEPLYWDRADAPDRLAILRRAVDQLASIGSGFAPAGWQIASRVALRDPGATNAHILAELENGASAIHLQVELDALNGALAGAPTFNSEDLARIFADVDLSLISLELDAGARTEALALLFSIYIQKIGLAGKSLDVSFGLDPFRDALLRGVAQEDLDADCQRVLRLIDHLQPDLPRARFIALDAGFIHEAGGTEVDEIAYLAACAAYWFRAPDPGQFAEESFEQGIDGFAGLMHAQIAIGPEFWTEIAKIRAMRLVFHRIASVFGVSQNHATLRIQARHARRHQSSLDPHANMLRATAAAFAAACGGVDSLTIEPMDAIAGAEGSAFFARMARNIPNILPSEGHLDRVRDPMGGAYAIESLTSDMAQAGWARFQAFEAQGGIVACLRRGDWQAGIQKQAAMRLRDFATRREILVGVSDYLPQASGGLNAPITSAPHNPNDPLQRPADIDAKSLQPNQLGLHDFDLPFGETIAPLSALRWGEPFEALHRRGEEFWPKTSDRPLVFFANLGALRDFSARAGFSAGLCALACLTPIGADQAYKDDTQILSAFRVSGAQILVLNGSDAIYQSRLAHLVPELKALGPARILLAGKPGASEAAWRELGIDDFWFMGMDVIAALTVLQHQALNGDRDAQA